MKKKSFFISIIISCLLVFTPMAGAATKASLCNFLSMGYINWSGALPYVDWSGFTHVLDAFGIPTSAGAITMTLAGRTAITGPAHTNSTYALISLGGSGQSDGFAGACGAARATFVNNCYALLTTYNYDGLDMDWEYPAAGADKTNFTATMSALYTRFQTGATKAYDGTTPLLTFYTTTGSNDEGFDFGQLGNYCDYAIQSGYDWGNPYNAPLRWFNRSMTSNALFTFEASVAGFYKSMTNDRGFPTNKMVLGLPAYGLPGKTGWSSRGGFVTYNTMAKEGQYGADWYTDVQGYADKIRWAKERGVQGIAMWSVNTLGAANDITGQIKTSACQVVATLSPTPTYDPVLPKLIDNWEDGEYLLNDIDGLWSTFAGAGCTTSITVTAGATGVVGGLITSSIGGSAWNAVNVTCPITPVANGIVNLSSTQGVRCTMKGDYGTGTSIGFRIRLISSNISDSSYLYTDIVGLNGTWRTDTVTWASFSRPGWGQGATATMAACLAGVTALQFTIIDLSGAVPSNTNSHWYLDNLYIMGTAPIVTPSNTITPTSTKTATQTITQTPLPASATPTATKTVTQTTTKTNTATATPSNTPPPTNTVTGTVTQTRTPLPTNTATETATQTTTRTSTKTSTPTNTMTSTKTVTPTGTDTPDFSPTITNTVGGPTETITSTVTKTNTPLPTSTITRTNTKTATETSTQTGTRTSTATATETVTPLPTGTDTPDYSPTVTRTVGGPSDTITPTITKTNTAVNTATITQTDVVVNTATITQTQAVVNSPTETSTIAVTVDPLLIDDAEDADMASNQQSGAWTTYASPGGSSVLLAAMPGGANSTGNSILFKGDVSGAGWPSISVATDLQSSGLAKDVSIYQGMTFWQRGTGCVGTSTSYLVMLVTDNITDASYWRTTVTIPAAWTQVNLNWASFAAPSWGGSQGEALTLADILPNVKAIQWVAADTSGGTAACTNMNWYIDEVKFIPIAVGTPTVTATITPTPIPGMIDNMEDNDMAKNMLDGSWTSWAAAGSSVALSAAAGGADGTNFTARMTGDVAGTGWPSISIATDLDPGGLPVDIMSQGSGLSYRSKGTGCTGTGVQYLVMPVSTDITDSSHWRATVTISAAWTQINIPWASFNAPGWGMGATMTRAQALANVRSFQWVATDGVGGTAACTGLDWYIDEIKYIVVMPTATTTPTVTTTQISSATFTPTSTLTSTPVNTNTITQTATITETLNPLFTLTFTPTITQTHTVTKTVTQTTTAVNTMTITPTQTSTIDVNAATSTPTPVSHDIVWPNPGDPEKDGITIRLTQTLSNTNCLIKIYTSSYRLVYNYKKAITTDTDIIRIDKTKCPVNLAQGVYYIVAEPEKGDRKIIKFIVMKKVK